MTIWNLIGFGTNWKRVDRMNEKAYLDYVAKLVAGVTYVGGIYHDMSEMIEAYAETRNLDEDAMAEDFYKIIKGFGPKIPTTTEYSRFWELNITGIPSARKVRKESKYQNRWDVAYKWAKEYEKAKPESIIAEKNKRISELEIELKEMNERIKRLEANFKTTEIEK